MTILRMCSYLIKAGNGTCFWFAQKENEKFLFQSTKYNISVINILKCEVRLSHM